MLRLVRRARGRLLRNELWHEGANAATAALVVFILLLILGAPVLDWRWALPVFVAAALGVWRALRRRPSPYRAAQIVDRRMALADAFSTALFFSRQENAAVSPAMRQGQFDRAGRLARSVDVRRAIPYTMPRAAVLMAALLLLASSLLALRYGISHRLDLKPPLARLLQWNPRASQPAEEAKDIRRDPPDNPRSQARNEAHPRPSEGNRGGDPQAPDPGKKPDPNPAAVPGAKKAPADGGQPGQQGDSGAEKRQDSRTADSGGQSGETGSPEGAEGQRPGAPPRDGSSAGNSLLDKFKDAVQNLLSRLNPQPASQGAQQQSERARNSQAAGGQNAAGQQGHKDGGQQSGGGQGDSRQGEADRMAQDSSGGRRKAAGQSEAQDASKQPGNGIGSQDGNKEIRQAERLAAMGKISEIFGKRAANISGEATVEVQSSPQQQLRTPYSERTARHGAAGSEIGRDEVPVALQDYVAQYFEQVRKQARK